MCFLKNYTLDIVLVFSNTFIISASGMYHIFMCGDINFDSVCLEYCKTPLKDIITL